VILLEDRKCGPEDGSVVKGVDEICFSYLDLTASSTNCFIAGSSFASVFNVVAPPCKLDQSLFN